MTPRLTLRSLVSFVFFWLIATPLFANSYSTTFPLTENPISEGGKWVNGGTTGLNWTNIRTTANVEAYGTSSGSGNGYDDSTAVLQGAGTWGPNQSASGIVYVTSVNNSDSQEVELRLNTTIAARSITGYECNYSMHTDGTQYSSIVRWNGPFGNFTRIAGPATGIAALANGDTLTCSNIDGTISMYHNGILINSVTDTTYTGGSPGIGTDLGGGDGSSTNGNFGFSSFSSSDQHAYYISKSLGNDANTPTQAQSKSTPWQHVPGMASGPSYTPVAGDQFILYGGDTWGTSDLPFQINQNGSGSCLTTPNSSCIYIGVDQTWYNSSVCGASWCRPIFSQQGTTQNWYAMAYIYGQNVTVDNIEFTGMVTFGGNTERMINIGGGGGGDVVEDCYFHGWNHSASGDADNSFVIDGGGTGSAVHDNVIDGADTLAATSVSGNPCGSPDGICQGMNTAINGGTNVYNNVIKNVSTGVATSVDIIHDNWIGPIWLGYSGGHRNGVQIADGVSLSYLLAYNNILTQVQNGGMGGFWLEQGSGNSGRTAYVFNNLLLNGLTSPIGLGEGMQFCQLGSSCGPFYAFNNTIEGQFALASGMSSTANLYNNHCLTSAGNCANNEGTWTVNQTTNLAQCLGTGAGCSDANASPHFDQYSDSQTYADSPVASTNSTVGAGTNEQSLCTTISGLDATAGAACQSDTGYTCSYNTSKHTVSCPDRSPFARPSSGAWDIGAYESLAVSGTTPNPPTSLTVQVQ